MKHRHLFVIVGLSLVLSWHARADTEGRCGRLAPADSQQTPVQLYQRLSDCAAEGQYGAAIDFYALAGVYGRYDTYRVADVSAHQVVGALKNAAFARIPPTQKAEFQKLAR